MSINVNKVWETLVPDKSKPQSSVGFSLLFAATSGRGEKTRQAFSCNDLPGAPEGLGEQVALPGTRSYKGLLASLLGARTLLGAPNENGQVANDSR